MGTRLLVNDCLTCIPGTRTFWDDLRDWFKMDFVGAPYDKLADVAKHPAEHASLIVRNATWFPPIVAECPQICLLQDIMEHGALREMQEAVIKTSRVVFNSRFTKSKYLNDGVVIPLPVDFDLFKPGNPTELQQEMNIPTGSICWVGACQGAAGHIKGWDILQKIARMNPDLKFMAVMKDGFPETFPPNMRVYCKLQQAELAKVMGACAVGLCTSRMESQHLAGIEMGACGLPLVVPPVGTYWNRKDIPGVLVTDGNYIGGIRTMLSVPRHAEIIREYWKREFDREVIKAQWARLIEGVENA